MPRSFFKQTSRRRRPSGTPAGPKGSGGKRERGVALIIAIVSIALLTVIATDFAYNSRVDLQLAANQRDEVRAYYMARSGIALSRLLLRFQKQVDQTPIPNPASILAQLGIGGTPQQGGQQTPQPTSLNIQLYKMARVDCHMLKGLVKSDGGGGETEALKPAEDDAKFKMEDAEADPASQEVAAQMTKRSFGGFEGCFLATITDEEEKLNVHRLMAGAGDAYPTMLRMLDMFNDKRFEFLWERDDANKVRSTPQDVVIAIKDWADDDETGSAINLVDATNPMPSGFSDEGAAYSRYEPNYEPKNARFDSLDELYRVHGVNDQFMSAFRDRLTVYPDINRRPNINTDDPVMMMLAVMSVADPAHPDPRLSDPVFVNELISRIRSARMFSFFGMSVQDFVAVVESAGIAVNPAVKSNVAGNRLVGDKSQTFTIKSVGEAGSVQKTLTAVVRLDDTLGRLLYWREE
jgi:general secretion pathway protein K